MQNHSLIDWRLALDIVELILGKSLNHKRWTKLANSSAQNFVNNINSKQSSFKLKYRVLKNGYPIIWKTCDLKSLHFMPPTISP